MKKLSIILLVIVLTGGPSGCSLFLPPTCDASKYKAIHRSAFDGNMVPLKELVQANPQLVNVVDCDGNTPLHSAALHGRVDAVGFLLESGADVNAKNSAGMTPLHLAARLGFLDVVKVLLSHHADLNIKDSRGWTPLTWAEKTHHDGIANLLRENGAHW